jgi:predicted dehydrogenase
MNSKRLRMGLVGPGFIATHHIDAVRRLGDVDIVGVAGSSRESAARKAAEFMIDEAFDNYEQLVTAPQIDVVHNTTPSHMHVPVTLAALRAGKHVVSDKPLAMTPHDCVLLCDAAAQAGVVNAVTFNYRGNPLVQEARARIAQGELGDVVSIHGQYLQDWMTDENVYSWRMDPVKGGVSSALADIGSHWCDLAEHIAGARIQSVLVDMTTVVKTRHSTGASQEAFSKIAKSGRQAIEVHGEDLATVLLRFDNGARGTLLVGQVLPGHKNDLQIEVNGRLGSLRWEQERQNDLWFGSHNRPNAALTKDPAQLSESSRPYAHLPGGHQEGWADAFRNVIADIYSFIRAGGNLLHRPPTLCTFADATRTCYIIDAMLRSAHAGGVWTEIEATAHVTPVG